jgi:Rod binding domain-containing protein
MDVLPALASPPVDLIGASGQASSAAELARRGQITKTSRDFEASFLSSMLTTMLQGVGAASGPFGGGPGEEMWTSFLADAMAKQMVRAGGIGVSKAVAREMLTLQGLKEAA